MLELRTRLRRLIRRPAYILSVLLSLGLGTAVSVAAFSFVNVLIFHPLPGVTDRRELIRVDWANGAPLTLGEFQQIESQQPRAFSLVAAQGTTPLPMVLPSGPETLTVAFVSSRFFDTLGTTPVAGRLLRDADGQPSAAPAVVISERLWRRAFDGRPTVLQTSLTIATRPFAVVGVTPDRFAGLRVVDLNARDSAYPDAWICLRDAALWPVTADVRTPWLLVTGRLAVDATPRTANAELNVIAARSAATGSQAKERPRTFRTFRWGLDWRDDPAQSLLTLGIFLFVPLSMLGIGCVNVVNLQLARAIDEIGELSLRLALGASRWRLVRLLLFEIAAVALLSTAIGCAGARVLLARANAVSPMPLAIDPASLGFAALLVTAVVCVTGLLPAWWSARDVVAAGLRELRDASTARVRFRGVLIVVQVAASVALLALSGLAIRSLLIRAQAAVPGAGQILTADFDVRSNAADHRAGRFVTAMDERLRGAASIRAVAFSTFGVTPGVMYYSRPADPPGEYKTAFGGLVSPQWFAVTGARFVAGGVRDDFPRNAGVVNRALASRLTGGRLENAVGMPLRVAPQWTIDVVAVVEDTQIGGDEQPLPMLLLPLPADPPSRLSLLVLTGDLADARQAIRAAVTAIDPALPLARLDTLGDRIDEQSSGMRALTSMAATFGVLSVALAGAGLHSLLSYAVRRRRREIGIRVALGARAHEIVWLALAPVLWLVLSGALAGLALAVPIAALTRAALFGVSAIDPRGLLPSVAILLAAALAGAAGPTLDAIRVQPIDALREE